MEGLAMVQWSESSPRGKVRVARCNISAVAGVLKAVLAVAAFGFADHVCALVVVVAPVPLNPLLLSFPAFTMFIRLSSRLHMSNVSFPLSSHTSILLSLLVSILLLAVIRAALLFLRSRTSSSPEKQTLVQEQSKNVEQQSSSPSSSWGLGFFTWDNLPTLPVSLKVNENDMKGRGVGFAAPQPPASQPWQPGRRSGPAFEQPCMSPGRPLCPPPPFANSTLPSSTRNVPNRRSRVHG